MTCPGCDQIFDRAGGLIDHIEKNACTGIKNDQLDARREEKLAFARELQRRHFGLDPDAKDDDVTSVITESAWNEDKGPANFSKYLSTKQVSSAGPLDTMRPNPLLFRMQERDFPQLPGEKQPATQANPGNGNPASTDTPWAEKKNLFANAPPPVRPTAEQLKAIEKPAEVAWEKWDINNPRFRATDHFNQFTGKYKCPHPRCPKSFGSGNALVAHIPAAHPKKALRVECPTCLRKFDSITALTQHSESQGVKCEVRKTEEFRQFVDQLTGGIVDTADLHDDGTNKYFVPEEAGRVFNRDDLQERARKIMRERIREEAERKKNYSNPNIQW